MGILKLDFIGGEGFLAGELAGAKVQGVETHMAPSRPIIWFFQHIPSSLPRDVSPMETFFYSGQTVGSLEYQAEAFGLSLLR